MNVSPNTIYGFPVRQDPIGGHAPLAGPISGVLHTTEGSTHSAVDTFHQKNDPPHFLVDSNSIIQFRALDQMAMALRHSPEVNIFKGATNGHAVQIEITGSSKQSLWIPDDNTVARLAAVMAYASKFHAIPLVVPNDWPDDCSDIPPPLATNSAKRNSRRIWAESHWPDVRGWWMHMEIPGQGPSWHWDCGAVQRTVLLKKASEFLNGITPP